MSDPIARLNAALEGRYAPQDARPATRRALPFLLLLAAVFGCANAGGAPASPPGQVSWPVGVYVLEATVEYQNDSAYGSNTVREDYFADLVIAPGNSLTLRNSSAVCRDPTRREVERDETLKRKTFRCGLFTYVVEPAGSTIRGEFTVTVDERIRRSGACILYRSDGQWCVEYRWTVNSRRTPKRARLTVVSGP